MLWCYVEVIRGRGKQTTGITIPYFHVLTNSVESLREESN
jgi:hypothetical protein